MTYRATNQTKNSLDNLPGIKNQPFITWKYKPDNNVYMSNRFSNTYIDNSNATYNLGIAVKAFSNKLFLADEIPRSDSI